MAFEEAGGRETLGGKGRRSCEPSRRNSERTRKRGRVCRRERGVWARAHGGAFLATEKCGEFLPGIESISWLGLHGKD